MAKFHSSWLKRVLTMGHPYKKSSHRKIYEEIAETSGCTPDRVYELAHGDRCRRFTDEAALSELMRLGIVR